MATAPYKRTHKHGKGRGDELSVVCSFCGKKVPKYKTFCVQKGFSISDSTLRKELPRNSLMLPIRRLYACPSCARHRKISQPGKSRKSTRNR
ncbi:MAG: hypothetical protein KAU95_01365 [Candidatus Aenigmarchaeota archaeon]|nr:hypothetical protein [Candidatus Aenigmarchaeota archaeon]